MSRWINVDSFLGLAPGISMKLRRRSSVFDVGNEELHLEALYSRTSYFMLLDLDTAIALSNRFSHVPTCLFVPSSEYSDVIDSLPLLPNVQLICFDEPSANKEFFEYLKAQESEGACEENEGNSPLTVTTPSVEGIIK
jgi:hypothetical protein